MRVIHKTDIDFIIRGSLGDGAGRYVGFLRGTKILDIQEQNGRFVVWYECDDTVDEVDQKYMCAFYTGENLERNAYYQMGALQYYKTVQTASGLVYHIYFMR